VLPAAISGSDGVQTSPAPRLEPVPAPGRSTSRSNHNTLAIGAPSSTRRPGGGRRVRRGDNAGRAAVVADLVVAEHFTRAPTRKLTSARPPLAAALRLPVPTTLPPATVPSASDSSASRGVKPRAFDILHPPKLASTGGRHHPRNHEGRNRNLSYPSHADTDHNASNRAASNRSECRASFVSRDNGEQSTRANRGSGCDGDLQG
jgi:hypothetical protein